MSSNPPVETHDNPHRDTLVANIIFDAIMLCLAGFGWYMHGEPESGMWITALFVVPWVIQLIGLWLLRKKTTSAFWWFNRCATFLCQAVYCLLWIMYSTSWQTRQGWSYFALIWTFVMLGFVGIMTFAILRKSNEQRDETEASPSRRWERFSEKLSQGVSGHPFWAIMLFMALFLGVSYLFAFALAFHDKNIRRRTDDEKPALYMVNLKSIEDPVAPLANEQNKEKTQAKTGGGQATDSGAGQAGGKTESVPDKQEEFCFYFDEIKAHISRETGDCDKPHLRGEPGEFKPSAFNDCNIKIIANRLKELTDSGIKAKVTLLGHTDNEPIKTSNPGSTPYLSNYELSEARAQNVKYEILQQMHNNKAFNIGSIEWAIFPASAEPLRQINHGVIDGDKITAQDLKNKGINGDPNDPKIMSQIETFFSPEELDLKVPKHEKRVVIATIEVIPQVPVYIQPVQIRDLNDKQGETLSQLETLAERQSEHIAQSQAKPMRLMDYIYFSVYTITTTGYGDIIPTTAYAKFVTSLANIFEVIFLVVFFNALLSLKEGPPPPGGQPTTNRQPAGGPDQTGQQNVVPGSFYGERRQTR